LVILAGPGGVVTMRLELELGPVPKWLASVGGVWLVELAPRSDVAAAVADTLGISSRAGAALTDALRGSVAD
jgi:predicted ATPase